MRSIVRAMRHPLVPPSVSRGHDGRVTAVPDEAELERLGLYDPAAPDADERMRVLRRVFELGATVEEVVEAAGLASLGDLALDLSIRPPGQTYDVEEFA